MTTNTNTMSARDLVAGTRFIDWQGRTLTAATDAVIGWDDRADAAYARVNVEPNTHRILSASFFTDEPVTLA